MDSAAGITQQNFNSNDTNSNINVSYIFSYCFKKLINTKKKLILPIQDLFIFH